MSVLGDDRLERRERKVPPRVTHSRVTPLEAVPVETVVEGEVGLCTQVIVPDRGVFVVLPVPQIDGELVPQQRYLGVWRDADSAEIYLFSRPVLDEVDLVQSVRNLQRDLEISVESLTIESETLEQRVLAAELEVEDATIWQPMTHAVLWEVMGVDPKVYEQANPGAEQVVAVCSDPVFGAPKELPCDDPGAPEALYEDILAAICTECTGSCCYSPDPCCGNPNRCCGVQCGNNGECFTRGCTEGRCFTSPRNGSCSSDGNACTRDICLNMVCTHQAIVNECCGPGAPKGTCNDNNACSVNDRCNNGTVNHCPERDWGTCCGTPKECPQDTDPCTNDYCDQVLGCVEGVNHTETYCGSDGNVCTSDYCYWGVCQSPTPNNEDPCDSDNKICTVDKCQGGGCTHPAGNDGVVCESDGRLCTNDVCAGGSCTHPPACPTGYTCNTSTGACTAPGPACGALTCLSGTSCCPPGPTGSQGICCPLGLTCCGNPPGMMCCASTTCCDDGNSCTTDSCPASGCSSQPVSDLCCGVNCNDNDACTVDAAYQNGTCPRTPKNCDDADACTTDSCSNGVCVHDPMVCASDGKTCTDDLCLYGDCAHINHPDGSRCSDPLDPCAEGICKAGICLLKACDGQCCDGLCCPAATMCCAQERICYGAAVLECGGLAVGGILLTCGCTPCVLLNDPQDEANDAVQSWVNATGQNDLCRIDAMQHCVGAALLASDCGGLCAVCAGEINEWIQGDGDAMDYQNNWEGALCAGATATEAVDCCESKLLAGVLILIGNCQ